MEERGYSPTNAFGKAIAEILGLECVMKRKSVFVLGLAFVVLFGRPTRADLRVAIWGDDDTCLSDIRSKVLNVGPFSTVDVVNIESDGVPTLAAASTYDSIMVFGGMEQWGSADSQSAGDVLADYADARGGIVTCTFVLGSSRGSWILKGRFDNDRYHVMKPVEWQIDGNRQMLGTVHYPNHLLMENVNTLDGGESSYRVPITQMVAGSVLVAEWSDGTPLVAVKELVDMGRRVDLNFFPPSSDVRNDFWQIGTDGDILLVNALTWAAPEPATLLLLGLGGLFLRRRR